jgi:hypothetical protein
MIDKTRSFVTPSGNYLATTFLATLPVCARTPAPVRAKHYWEGKKGKKFTKLSRFFNHLAMK